MATYNLGSDGADDYADWTTMQLSVTESAGDIVSFRKGDTFRETVTVPASGASGNVITYTAHGSGADPIIDGSDLVATWTQTQETVGETNTNGDWRNADVLYYYQVTTTNGGVLKSYHCYIAGTANITHLKAALYTDSGGHASSLVANTESAEITSFSTSAWNTLTVSGGATLAAATTYHVAIFSDGTSATISRGGSNPISCEQEAQAYGSFPASATPGAAADGDSLYMTLELTNVWQATCTTQPYLVAMDGTVGANESAITSLNTDKEWFWNGNVLYQHSTSDPDARYTTPGTEAGKRDYCFYAASKDYITIQNLDLKGGNSKGVLTSDCENWIVSSNTIQKLGGQVGSNGIMFNTAAFSSGVGNNTASSNTISNCHGDGIYIKNEDNDTIDSNTITACYGTVADNIQSEGCQNYTISNNTLSQQGTTSPKGNFHASGGSDATINNNICGYGGYGISCADDDSIVEYNLVYNHTSAAWSAGLYMADLTIDNVTWRYNISYGDTRGIGGVGSSEKTTFKFYNNVVYNSGSEGVNLKAIDGEFKNNIIHCDSVTGEVYRIESLASGGSWDSDYNCFYPEGTAFIYYVDTSYNTLAAYQSGKSKDANSIKDDPVFINTGSNYYSLQSTSPCIDAGVDVSLTTDYAGSTVPAPSGGSFDMGAFEYVKMTPAVQVVASSVPGGTPSVEFFSGVATGPSMGMGIGIGI